MWRDTVANDTTQAWTIDDYGRPEDLKLGTRPLPELGDGDVLVAVEATSLNPLDLKLISGMMREFMPVEFPFCPGSDVCGRVLAVGAGAAFEPGDRIVGMTSANGGMSQRAVLSARAATAKVANDGDAAVYATLPEAGMTALAILKEAGEIEGRTVAVIGATGGIGLILCQLAARAGATVIATAAGDEDEALVRANGAAEVLDYSQADPAKLLVGTHPKGVDVLIDLINQFDALIGSASPLITGGRLVSTLIGPDPSKFPPHVDVHYVRLAPSAADLVRLVEMVEAGDVVPTVSLRFPFVDARDAYLTLRDGHVRGKIVVEAGR
jgi:NADPH:quinone reductase